MIDKELEKRLMGFFFELEIYLNKLVNKKIITRNKATRIRRSFAPLGLEVFGVCIVKEGLIIHKIEDGELMPFGMREDG